MPITAELSAEGRQALAEMYFSIEFVEAQAVFDDLKSITEGQTPGLALKPAPDGDLLAARGTKDDADVLIATYSSAGLGGAVIAAHAVSATAPDGLAPLDDFLSVLQTLSCTFE